jgi:hypothetical protein
MRIARPATGFVLSEPGTFQSLLKSHAGKWPRVFEYWEAIKDRLKMTGHKEGVVIGGNLSHRLFEAEGDAQSGLPTIRVAYRVLGDRLDFIKLALLDPP